MHRFEGVLPSVRFVLIFVNNRDNVDNHSDVLAHIMKMSWPSCCCVTSDILPFKGEVDSPERKTF